METPHLNIMAMNLLLFFHTTHKNTKRQNEQEKQIREHN